MQIKAPDQRSTGTNGLEGTAAMRWQRTGPGGLLETEPPWLQRHAGDGHDNDREDPDGGEQVLQHDDPLLAGCHYPGSARYRLDRGQKRVLRKIKTNGAV